MYDTEETRLKFIEKEVDEVNRKLSPIIHKCDGIHRVNCIADFLCILLMSIALILHYWFCDCYTVKHRKFSGILYASIA